MTPPPVSALRSLLLLLALAVCGCSAETEDGPSGDGGGDPCLPPSRSVDGHCREPGVQDNGCPAGSWLAQDDSCQPAGIALKACAEGFMPTDDAGCEPILPAAPCPPGEMAVPGDVECHPIMACGTGRWGNIAVDATTIFVDQGYDPAAGPSDGSQSHPYTTVGDAVAAALDGTLIAIAAGSYVEDVLIQGRALRLWGKCPAEVELMGTGDALATVYIRQGASGSELAGLAIRGPTIGVAASGSQNLALHHLWVHDNASRGINIESPLGPTSASVTTSLIEHNHELGFYVGGANLTIDAVVLRDTQPRASDQRYGRGINIRDHASTGARSQVSARAMVVDRNHELGFFIAGSDVELDAVVVRGTLPNIADQTGGGGMAIQVAPETGAPAAVGLRGSLIDSNHDTGLLIIGSEVHSEALVVRDTLPQASNQTSGSGIAIQDDLVTAARSNVSLHGALIQDNHSHGIFIAGSDAALDAVVVRGTRPQPVDQRDGIGVLIQKSPDSLLRSTVQLSASLIDGNHVAGVALIQSDAQLLGVSVTHTLARADGLYGDGVVAADRGPGTTISLSSCSIGWSARAGHSAFAATSSIATSSFSCNAFHLAGEPHGEHASELTDGGGNRCACGDEDQSCKAVSVGLAPPASL